MSDAEGLGLDLSMFVEALSKRESSRWHAKKVGVYHASQLPYCLLKQWYGFQEDVVEEVSPQSRVSMFFGSQFHWAMENVILPHVEEAFRVVAVEQPVYHRTVVDDEEILLVGQFDAVIQGRDGRYAILENKTVKDLFYVRERGAPQEHHELQSSLYMRTTNIPRAVYLYWGWAQMEPLFLEAPYRPEYFKRVREAAVVLHRHLVAGEPPEPCPCWTWECGSADPDRYGCGYRSICPLSEAEKSAGRVLSPGARKKVFGGDGVDPGIPVAKATGTEIEKIELDLG